MSDVANLENCKELYEVSGWEKNVDWWYESFMHVDSSITHSGKIRLFDDRVRQEDIPAYTLGYLIRKLPPSIKVELAKRVFYEDTGEWSIDLTAYYGDSFYWTEDFSTPEDALASLLIRLIKDKDVDDVEIN